LRFVSELGIYKIISAVDGRNLSAADIVSSVDRVSYLRRFKRPPEVGTVGCALSHAKVLRTFLESKDEFALVFEDDIQFNPTELSAVVQSLISRKHLWDIVGLELSHHGFPLEIAKLELPQNFSADNQCSSYYSLVIYLTNVKHSGAYLINRKAAQQLMETFFPIRMPFDHYFTHYSVLKSTLKFTGVEPRIVHQTFWTSEIKTDNLLKAKAPLAYALSSIFLNLASAVGQLAHGLYHYLRIFCS
jgi:glycosyl transferase family 25